MKCSYFEKTYSRGVSSFAEERGHYEKSYSAESYLSNKLKGLF